MGRPRSTDLDPDYDDDGSPKYATDGERAAGWAQANHAPHPEAISAIVDAAAALMWDHSGAVESGIRPKWADAVHAPHWAAPVRQTRQQALLAVTAARRALAASILTQAAEEIFVPENGRHPEYIQANRHDVYLLKVKASEYIEGAR